MEEKICQRISEVLEDKHISYNALSKMLGMTQPTVLRQVKGGQTLSSSLVERFLNTFPEVSSDWLMRGCGSKYDTNEPTTSVQVDSDSIWKAKYEELEKRYDQLLAILGGGVRQKVNVG